MRIPLRQAGSWGFNPAQISHSRVSEVAGCDPKCRPSTGGPGWEM